MVIYILVAASGLLLAWLASMWVIVFWLILRDGSITLIEPCQPVLFTEFALAICLTLCGIAVIVYGVIKGKEGKHELSGMDQG